MSNFTESIGIFQFAPNKSVFELMEEFVDSENLDEQMASQLRGRLQQAEIDLSALRAREKVEQ